MITDKTHRANNTIKPAGTGHIIDNKKIAHDIYQMTIEAPDVAYNSKPGQFVSLLCSKLVLRRPFSISNVKDNCFQIIYKLKGEGTDYMSGLKAGQSIDYLGPLGNGFDLSAKRALLVGAGVGIAPLIYLTEVFKYNDVPFTMLAGFQSFVDIKELAIPECTLVTEDGSSTAKGRVTDFIEEKILNTRPDRIYACGPHVVLQKTVKIANTQKIDTEVALEEKFACGIGVCMGCIIEVYENDEIVNKRVCKDGPVFKGETVVW